MLNIKKFFNLDYYTSELDQFLAEYAKKRHQVTPSQKAEADKHKHVANLRDNANAKRSSVSR